MTELFIPWRDRRVMLRWRDHPEERAMAFERDELTRRLLDGESLEVTTGGGQYEVWVEPYANPPVVYYEGQSFPLNELDEVISTLLAEMTRQEVRCRWLDARGLQAKTCQEAYRAHAAETAQGRSGSRVSSS
jgi:hypothetical protein